MNSRLWMPLALLLGAIVGADHEQDPKPTKKAEVRVPDGETLRRAQELSRTDVHHDRIAKLAGQWKVTVRTPMAGGKFREDKGTVIGAPVLGGRYVALNYKLRILGRDIEALQMVGFDTLRSRYTSTWRDNQTTWSLECSGEPGKDADLLQLSGRLHDAESPDGKPVRVTYDLRSKGRVKVQIHTGTGKDEVLMQEQVWSK